jgi:hypothetical protein
MAINTAWSEGRQPTVGQDQLGIRGNAVRMYNHLLPGITNVTNRVRYYSMHSWFIQWWAKNVSTDDYKAFRRKMRIFECIVGMAERIRNVDEGKDFLSITGSNTFQKWLHSQGTLKSNTSVPLNILAKQYWKHPGGGFGQYYNSSAQALGIIRELGKLYGLTPEFGVPLADAFEETTELTILEKMVRQETATVGQLRNLVKVATFQEIRGQEGQLLKDILFDENNYFGDNGVRRRNSLLTILALAQETSGGIKENPLWQVLDAALHGRIGKKDPFNIPEPLKDHLSLWKSYALQEYFASGLEVLLALAVETVGEKEHGKGCCSVREIAESIAEILPSKFIQKKWGNLISESIEKWHWPMLDPKKDPFDEQTLREKAIPSIKIDWSQALAAALNLIARVTARIADVDPYEGYRRGKMYLMPGRISLLDWSIFSKERTELSCRELLIDAITLGLNAHLRIAGLKLIYTRVYTYKVAFFNGNLTRVDRMEPALNQPRLMQATRMLVDLQLLCWKDGGIFPTSEGLKMLRKYGCA